MMTMLMIVIRLLSRRAGGRFVLWTVGSHSMNLRCPTDAGSLLLITIHYNRISGHNAGDSFCHCSVRRTRGWKEHRQTVVCHFVPITAAIHAMICSRRRRQQGDRCDVQCNETNVGSIRPTNKVLCSGQGCNSY